MTPRADELLKSLIEKISLVERTLLSRRKQRARDELGKVLPP